MFFSRPSLLSPKHTPKTETHPGTYNMNLFKAHSSSAYILGLPDLHKNFKNTKYPVKLEFHVNKK